MAANDGEQRLLTYYADVHYYFDAPTPRPAAHRFDKASYLYLYGKTSGTGARLEIANNVRKPEQDAFTGTLESSTIRQSHKHPTLCTVTVDGIGAQEEHDTTSVSQPEHHWRLPNTDPRNEGKYLFRLHTLDIYFWKPEDAHAFMAALKARLKPNQVEILDAPATPAAHQQAMSPVVQQLENVAVQDSAYQNGQTRNSRTTSDMGAMAARSDAAHTTKQEETPKAQDPASFQPLAYNPAAPAAPEPIKHREKTPPPIDAEEGTGLAGAAYRDHTHAMSSQSSLSRPPYGQAHPSQGYRSPPPPQTTTPSFASPSPSMAYTNSTSSTQGQRTSSVSSFPPPPPSQNGRGSANPYTSTPSFAPPPQNHQSYTPQNSQQLVPAPSPDHAPFYAKESNPPETPTSEILGDSYIAGVRQPLQHLQPQYANFTPSPSHDQQSEPVGGYSDYQYDQQHPHQHHHHHHQSPDNEYDVHSQVYRPTPEEAGKKKPARAPAAAPGTPTGRLEQGAGKVDKKVNSFFKKLEKKIG